jgi:hypothetical protein
MGARGEKKESVMTLEEDFLSKCGARKGSKTATTRPNWRSQSVVFQRGSICSLSNVQHRGYRSTRQAVSVCNMYPQKNEADGEELLLVVLTCIATRNVLTGRRLSIATTLVIFAILSHSKSCEQSGHSSTVPISACVRFYHKRACHGSPSNLALQFSHPTPRAIRTC